MFEDSPVVELLLVGALGPEVVEIVNVGSIVPDMVFELAGTVGPVDRAPDGRLVVSAVEIDSDGIAEDSGIELDRLEASEAVPTVLSLEA